MPSPSREFSTISGFSRRRSGKPRESIKSVLWPDKYKFIFAIKKKGLLTGTSILIHSARFVSLTALGLFTGRCGAKSRSPRSGGKSKCKAP
jgi:hypothetical protein